MAAEDLTASRAPLRIWRLLAAFGLFTTVGCFGPVTGLYPPQDGQRQVEIFVVDNHWHTSIVVPFAELSATLQGHLARFEGSEFVEIGWGDEGFYRAKSINSGLALQAALCSRGSVVHVLGLNVDPETFYSDYLVELYRLRITAEGMDRLNVFLEKSFRTSSDGSALSIEPGMTGGHFYWARGRYGAFHTCNHWLADGLRATGLPISPAYSFTAANVSWQIRRLGARYQPDVTVQRQ